MSHSSKIKEPKKNTPTPQPPKPLPATLGISKEELISEFKRLDALLSTVNAGMKAENEKIAAAQQKVEAYRNQGLQFVGQANVVTRQLSGMGFDTASLTNIAPPIPPNSPDFIPSEPENEAEVPEPKEVASVSAIKNRFAR